MWKRIFVLLTIVWGTPEGKAGEIRLNVRVCNFSSADNGMLFQAEAVARRIFQDAGVDTEWEAASDPGKLDASTLTVQIFAGRSQRSDLREAFGVAVVGTAKRAFLADVFFGAIEETTTSRRETAILLGHIMAHEVGHLLLGGGHTPKTIMAESLGLRDLAQMGAGQVRFSPRQAERLRAAATVRQSSSQRAAGR